MTTNVRFAASEHRVYDYSVREYDAASVSGISESELLRANGELVRYFREDDPGPLRIEVTDRSGQVVSLFSAKETAHLADVRDLFRAVFTVQVVSLAAALTLAVVVLVLWPVRALAAALLYASILTAGLLLLVGAVALVGFEAAWERFHFVAFANDLWRLDPATDHLIQMFPEPFWQDISLLLGALTLLEAMVMASVAGLYLLMSRPQGSEATEQVHTPLLLRTQAPPPRPRVPPPPHPRHFVR